jgi:hypothetical protein
MDDEAKFIRTELRTPQAAAIAGVVFSLLLGRPEGRVAGRVRPAGHG